MLIYRHLAIMMVYSEKVVKYKSFDEMRRSSHKKAYIALPYNCLYQNKGHNSSVKGSILTKLIGYRESMVLTICTKNESNLTNRY